MIEPLLLTAVRLVTFNQLQRLTAQYEVGSNALRLLEERIEKLEAGNAAPAVEAPAQAGTSAPATRPAAAQPAAARPDLLRGGHADR